MPESPADPTVVVIGLADDRLELLTPEARSAVNGARVMVGGRRHLALWAQWSRAPATALGGPERIEIAGGIDELVATVRRRAIEQGLPVCVLASGDPGFFGIVRALSRSLDRRTLRIVPAPSSVAVAFARLGLPWDDAVVVSAHGRSLDSAVRAIRSATKVAVLTSPDSPPEAVGRALVEERVTLDLVAVCSRLGSSDEDVRELTLAELAAGRFDPLSVVLMVGPGGLPVVGWSAADSTDRAGPSEFDHDHTPRLAWGLPDHCFDHRNGMITKSEVRSIVLGKLALPSRGVLWDVGTGSGSVAIECAAVRPGLTVLAVEQEPADAARATANALTIGVPVHVVTGRAPEALAGLPAPDRAFVGGGGIDILRQVLERLRPGGRLVATFAALDRAAEAAALLGNLVQVGVDRGERLPDGGWRLVGGNPVFIAWGPSSDDADADADVDTIEPSGDGHAAAIGHRP